MIMRTKLNVYKGTQSEQHHLSH